MQLANADTAIGEHGAEGVGVPRRARRADSSRGAEDEDGGKVLDDAGTTGGAQRSLPLSCVVFAVWQSGQAVDWGRADAVKETILLYYIDG